jgi:hypothetical protein
VPAWLCFDPWLPDDKTNDQCGFRGSRPAVAKVDSPSPGKSLVVVDYPWLFSRVSSFIFNFFALMKVVPTLVSFLLLFVLLSSFVTSWCESTTLNPDGRFLLTRCLVRWHCGSVGGRWLVVGVFLLGRESLVLFAYSVDETRGLNKEKGEKVRRARKGDMGLQMS